MRSPLCGIPIYEKVRSGDGARGAHMSWQLVSPNGLQPEKCNGLKPASLKYFYPRAKARGNGFAIERIVGNRYLSTLKLVAMEQPLKAVWADWINIHATLLRKTILTIGRRRWITCLRVFGEAKLFGNRTPSQLAQAQLAPVGKREYSET
jgi:hypothetical protein